MSNRPRIKYEKPVSIDMGRVSPVLGDMCSNGEGASDCGQGFNNTVIPSCGPTGAGATNWCQSGTSAGSTCSSVGSSASFCGSGSSATYGYPPSKGGSGPITDRF